MPIVIQTRDDYQPDNDDGIQHYGWYHPAANGEWDDASLDRTIQESPKFP